MIPAYPPRRLRLVLLDQWARNAELRGEVARCQASPRQSMSTNTLRMMGPPYDGLAARATGNHRLFDMRDARIEMEDSRP